MLKNKLKKLFACVSAAAMVAAIMPAAVVNAAVETIQVDPSEATYINAASPSTNYASSGELIFNRGKVDNGAIAIDGSAADSRVALVKFDVSEYMDRIKAAEIEGTTEWTDPPNQGKGVTNRIAATGTDWSDTSLTWSSSASDLGTVELYGDAGGGKEPNSTVEYDLTDAITGDSDGIVSYAIFATTGREQKITDIHLNLTLSDYTSVTVNYVEQGNTSNILKQEIIPKVWEGDTYTVPEEMLGNIIDGEDEYALVSGAVTSITDVSESNNVLNIEYVKKEFTDVTVNYVAGNETIKTVLKRLELGTTYTVPEDELGAIEYNGNYYTKSDNAVTTVTVAPGAVLNIDYVAADGWTFYDDDFSSYANQTLVKVSGSYAQTYEDDNYAMECGLRPNHDSAAFEIAFNNGQIAAAQTKYTDSDRYGRIYLKKSPTDGELYYASVDFKTNSAEALVFADVTGTDIIGDSANSEAVGVGTHNGIKSDTWYTAEFVKIGNKQTFTIKPQGSSDVLYSADTALTAFTRIDIRNGVTYLDNLVVKSLSSQEVVDLFVEEYGDITAGNSNVEKVDDTYSIVGDFNVAAGMGGLSGLDVSWEAFEKPVDGTDWTTTDKITVNGTTVTALKGAANTEYKLQLTVSYGAASSVISYPVSLLSDQENVDKKKDELKIPKDGDNDAEYAPTDDFDVDTLLGTVNISWAVVDKSDDENVTTDGDKSQVAVQNGKIILLPTAEKNGGQVTLRATLKYGDGIATKDFIIDLDTYLNDIKTKTDAAAALKSVYANDDNSKHEYLGALALDGFDASNPLSYDLKLPSAAKDMADAGDAVTDSNIAMTWASNNANLVIADGKGEIAVSDTGAYPVALTKTASYVKNGQTLYTAAAGEYNITVQFDPEAVAVWATGDKQEKFLHRYQVKLDAACAANFSDVTPASGNISSSTVTGLKTIGVFGSSINWDVSNSTYMVLSNSTDGASKSVSTRNLSSLSGNQAVTLTAVIKAGEYTSNDATKTYQYTITGTKTSSNNSGSHSVSGSGTTTTIANPTTSTPAPVVTRTPAEEAFDDIDSVESWAGDAIRALYDKGIISGKGDKIFAPYDNVTRGEFAKMVVGAFGLSRMPEAYHGFTDVPTGHWCFNYIEIACAAGVINGYEDGAFGVNDNITRQDMAVMVMRAAEAANVTISDNGNSAEFADAALIADYASEAVAALAKGGIINGIDGSFEPVSNANRAQAAKILAGFINK